MIEVIIMSAMIRLKTGFFRTSVYQMMFEKTVLRLVPKDSSDELPADDILSVTIRGTNDLKQVKIEITAKSKSFEGIFCSDADYADYAESMRLFSLYHDIKIVYESL